MGMGIAFKVEVVTSTGNLLLRLVIISITTSLSAFSFIVTPAVV